MAQTMTINQSRASWYWCGEPYNNLVMGNTGTIVIKEGCNLNSSGRRETASAGIYEFDLSSIPENRIVTGLRISIPVTSIQSYGVSYTKEELGETPNIINVWRSTRYDLSDFTSKSHTQLVEMKNPYDGYSILTDTESPVSFNASLYLFGTMSTTIPADNIPENKKIYVMVNRNNSYQQGYAIYLGAASLAVTYDTIVPNAPTDLVPNGSIRNKRGPIRLSWTYLDEQLGTLQSKYDLIYSTNNFATSQTISATTSDNYCDIPANTFSEGQQVRWRVRAYNSFGDPSEYSSVALFTIGATPPDKPEPLKPVNVVNYADPVMFGWKYVDQYQGTQGAYILQYRKGSDVTELTGTTSNTHTIGAGLLEGGDHQWRVKVANQYGEYSEWSDWTAFYSIGRPDKPIITSISGGCRPLVTWRVTEEDAWELKIMQGDNTKYATGTMPGMDDNQYQIPEFLPAGNYVLTLRVRNVYGLWSEESKQAFTVSFMFPARPILYVTPYKETVILRIESETERNLLYREIDGEIVVRELAGSDFTDFTVSGDYRYFVRSITEDGYMDSDPVTGSLYFEGITIAGTDSPEEYVRLQTTYGEAIWKTATPANDVSLFNCNGRLYPVAQYAGYKSYIETHEYYLEKEEYQQFEAIQKKNTLFFIRDGGGSAFRAVMTNYSVKQNYFGYLISFTVEKVEG